MPKDFLEKELAVGDEVVFMQVNYRNLLKGTIVSLGAKKATIKHPRQNVGNTVSIQFYEQIIKIRGANDQL